MHYLCLKALDCANEYDGAVSNMDSSNTNFTLLSVVVKGNNFSRGQMQQALRHSTTKIFTEEYSKLILMFLSLACGC